MEHFFGSDSDKLLAGPITKEKGHDAYHLIPIYKSIASFIANTEEQKVVHIKYQQNVLNRSDLSGASTSEKFGKLTRGETDTVRRTLKTQPYLTFRLELDNRQVSISADQKGMSAFFIILGVLSMIGGLATAFAKAFEKYINGITKRTFLRRAVRKLYLLENQEAITSKLAPVEGEEEELTPFDKMKLNLANGKVSGEDIDNIVQEARYGRRPIEILTNNITYKIYGFF